MRTLRWWCLLPHATWVDRWRWIGFFFRVYSTTQTITTYAYSPLYGHTYTNKLRHSQHTHTHPSMNMQTIASITPLNPEKFAPIGSRTHDLRLAPIGSQTQNLRCYWNFCNHHATDPFAMNWPFWRHSPLNHLKFARYWNLHWILFTKTFHVVVPAYIL